MLQEMVPNWDMVPILFLPFFSFFFFKILFIYLREQEWEGEHKQGEHRGRGRSRFPAEQGAGAWSQDSGIMTWAKGRCLPNWATQVPLFLSLWGIMILPLQLQDWKSHGDRTVLVITHRLETVQSADQILVLREGELLEHAQILEGQDLYSRLVQQLLEDWGPRALGPFSWPSAWSRGACAPSFPGHVPLDSCSWSLGHDGSLDHVCSYHGWQSRWGEVVVLSVSKSLISLVLHSVLWHDTSI